MNKTIKDIMQWMRKNPLEFSFQILIITLIGYYLYTYLYPSQIRYTSNNGKGVIDLVLVYAPWCGHSKVMLPDYDRVIADYHGKETNGYTVNILKYNSDIDKEEVKKRNVKGYPSLFIEMNGESKIFSKRKYDDIVAELKSLLSQ